MSPLFYIKMGKRDRERIERIKAGTELPLSATRLSSRPVFYQCRTCGHFVIESGLEKHREECKTLGFVMVGPKIKK